MASYQIPQFLDSGDKIFLSMNLRQFGYAIGFSMLSFAIYQICYSIFPGGSFYNLIPAAPSFLLGMYLSFGKYNSRDSEIYVLQAILYVVKPRKLVYVRQAEIYDLEEKLASITASNIAQRMKERTLKSLSQTETKFDEKDRAQKAQAILKLANAQDSRIVEAMEKAAMLDMRKREIDNKITAARMSQQPNGAATPGAYKQNQTLVNMSQTPYQPSQLIKENGVADSNTQSTYDELQDQNFFLDQEQFK
ncbi:MAG: hypothetical protein OHK0017_07310 [Patescibacteria group bacterium]